MYISNFFYALLILCLASCDGLKESVEQYEFRVKEELPVGTFVAQIPNPLKKEGYYSFLKQDGDGFRLNKRGEIYTKEVFDHETLSSRHRDEGFMLNIKRGDGFDSSFIIVRVFIKDVNDNRPTFPMKSHRVTVPEDFPPGQNIAFPNAVDPDYNSKTEMVYSIKSGDVYNNFRLEKVRLGGELEAKYLLVLNDGSELDVETKTDQINLTISACDQASRLCSYLDLFIHIEDVNDNLPIFDPNLPDSIEIYENVSLSVPIFKVKATDLDRGTNGEIEYEIFNNQEFGIHPRTGEIHVVTKDLDAEKDDLKSMLIIAKDKGTPSKKRDFYFRIKILDCNDEAPELKVHPRKSGIFQLMEEKKPGEIVGTLSVIDIDITTANNQITKVFLTSGKEYFKLERTNDQSLNGRKTLVYFIKTIRKIDREKVPSILFSANAIDSGSPTLTGTVNFTMHVEDINDNPPRFDNSHYNVKIKESEPIGTLVIQVKAIDPDFGQNADISYSIISKEAKQWFYVDADTGKIILNDVVDREEHDHILIQVLARDHGTNALTATAVVNVTILDTNDNDPEFVMPNMEYSISENNKIGDFVGKMKVHDRDLIGSDKITCSLVGNVDNFRVMESTCELFANKVFDREKVNRYFFEVIVTDGLGRKSKGKVHVSIVDVNDNMPKFITNFFNVSVHTNFPVRHTAAFLKAYDPDEGENAKQLFSATFEKGDGFSFNIDSYSGGIILLTDLKKIHKTRFLFTTSVTDKANKQPSSADTARVQLNVLPPSTRPPYFDQFKYVFSINENNKHGKEVGQVKAKRPVSNSETFMRYSIRKGNIKEIFQINQDNGMVTATKSIDYEEFTEFELTVEAKDVLQPSLANNVTVIVKVVDMNDNKPRFTNRNNVINVKEGVAIGHLLYTCRTKDLDNGKNGDITYAIKHATSHFTVNPMTGEVRTNGSLDYETSENHVIYVEATDGGEPALSTIFKIEVKVEDVNDNPPLFFNSSQMVMVYENNKVDQVILKLNASDADSGKNGRFYFLLLENGDAESFKLLSNGELYVTKSLDRESKAFYSLRVKVQDYGIPSRSSEATITVLVGDENDEAPKFEKSHYIFRVKEEMPIGTIVGSVIAVDSDSGDNGRFTYYLRDQHKDKFEIETRQSFGKHICIIKTKNKFDSEAEASEYNITIGASDHGMTGNSNEVFVQIQIQNINDHPPRFTRSTPYVTCVNFGTSSDVEVVKVTARDLDKVQVNLVYSLIVLDKSHEISSRIFRIAANGTIFTKVKLEQNTIKQAMYEMIVRVEEKFQDADEYHAGRSYTNYQKVIIFVAPKSKGILFKEKCPHITIKASDKKGNIVKRDWYYDTAYEIGMYRIVPTNIPFSIRPTTGIIKVISNQFQVPYYQLNVTAEGKKDPSSKVVYTESIILNVYVVPKNMYPPSYPKNPETYYIAENHPINIPISILKEPIDRDKGMEGRCIFSIEDSVDAPVKISPLTREITFTRPIDREKNDKIVVKIRVSDLAEELPLRLSNTLTVAIFITDVNDNPPKFISKDSINVLEDEKPNSVIENILAVDPDMGETKTNIEYAIVSGNYDNTFRLDLSTGALIVMKSLSIRRKSMYKLKIMATEKRDSKNNKRKIPSLNSTFALTINIQDVNNQRPKFLKPMYKAHVKENEPIGTQVIQLDSVDEDLKAEYKEVVYEIIEKDIGFEINHKTGMISTTAEHDRENRKKYVFDVIVRNVAPPHGEDTCAVEVIIDDVNDNPPRFSGGPHEEHHILENSKPVPRPFYKLLYTDEDDSKNSKVTFTIVDFIDPTSAIRLDSKTGELWLDEVLDREKRSLYTFTVEAKNVQPPHHKAEQKITVVVDDENDEDPVFLEKLYRKTVNEGQQVNTTVLMVTAVDQDIASNAEVRYSIVNASNDALQHFSVSQLSGAIKLDAPLDYESQKFYKFQVKATGLISESFDVTTVEIVVKDENDNKPIFSRPVYDFQVEQIQTQKSIGKVKATDRDIDGKQGIEYNLQPEQNRQFSINKRTGEIFIKNINLIHGQYQLHVVAIDKGLPPKMKSKAQVLVTTPVKSSLRFINSSVVFTINENPPKDLYLGKVVALSQTMSKIKYGIETNSNPDSGFRINEDSGELYVNNESAVDFEKRENFFLGILVTTEQPKDIRFLHVLVNLTDVNDNSPQILPRNRTFHYAETNTEPFKPIYIYQFLVHDDDKIDKDRLKLQIISGNEDGLFHVDQWHRLSLIKNMDYEKRSHHHLVVRVTDGGNPVRHQDSHLYFIVEDENDNEPIFEKIRPIDVSEAAEVGSLLTQVRANDKDKKMTKIKYSITQEGSSRNISMFQINDISGKIFLVSPLDFEKTPSYKLRVCAFDGVHRSYGTLRINVNDVNDHSPRFSKAIYTVTNVNSPFEKDQFIIKVDATDQDQGDYGFVQYKLEPSRDPFMIDQYTGKIFANKPYKFVPGVVKLTVVAYDSKNLKGSRHSKAIVEVHITQVKFPDPQFDQVVYNFNIDEHTPEGVHIGKVTARFLTGEFREITYRIIDGNAGAAFTIDRDDGYIKTHRDLDREKKSKYTLLVVAEVKSLPADVGSVSAKCHVKILINDINDNQPIFEKSVYHVTKQENIPIGTKLLQVKATDADDPKQPYGKLIYSIHSGQEGTQWLWINETDGTIKTRERLDREVTDTIQLSIRVADVEGTGMEAFTSLNVTVLDVNDNAPDFNYDLIQFYDIHIKENLAPHTAVFKANAKDKDIGENGRVSYKILKGSGMDFFYMNDSIPGWVFTRKSLDFEKFPVYDLSVLAYDQGTPKQESSVEYNIYVDDVNEYQPVFKAPHYSFDIYSDLSIGSVIGNVSATDEDGGTAGAIFYSINAKGKQYFAIDRRSGNITVNKDLRRYEITHENQRKRRSINSVDSQKEHQNIQKIQFRIIADNGPNTTAVSTDVLVRVNHTCPDCTIYTTLTSNKQPMKTTTTVVVLASIAVFLVIIVVLAIAYFLRKKGCFQRGKHPSSGFCTTKKDNDLSSSVERELLNSGVSSFDRLQQHFYNGDHATEKSRISSETGLLPDESGTGRSVSATDKASTYSFGIYHEQGKPESDLHRLGDTLSEMTLIKELEDDSVFGYSSGKLKSEPSKSLISRSTQESSLYSLSSTAAHRTGFNFVPRQTTKMMPNNRSESHESLKDFMEEGGGEAAGGIDVGNLLYAKLAEVSAEERDAIMESVRPFQDEGPLSHGGSFSTIIGSDEDVRRSRDFSYNWKPQQYHPISSIYSEIGRTGGSHSHPRHPPINYGYNPTDVIVNNSVAKQPHLDVNINNRLRHPDPGKGLKTPLLPPQQTQSQIVDIPLQVLSSGRTSMLSSVTSLPRLPQELQSTYTSGALSPNFTPAITPLVFRSPSVSSIGTQEEFTSRTNKSARNNFDMGFTNLRRADSNVSQLSRITLSDLEISDAEIEV